MNPEELAKPPTAIELAEWEAACEPTVCMEMCDFTSLADKAIPRLIARVRELELQVVALSLQKKSPQEILRLPKERRSEILAAAADLWVDRQAGDPSETTGGGGKVVEELRMLCRQIALEPAAAKRAVLLAENKGPVHDP